MYSILICIMIIHHFSPRKSARHPAETNFLASYVYPDVRAVDWGKEDDQYFGV